MQYAARTKCIHSRLLETCVFINMKTGWKQFPDLEQFKCEDVEGADCRRGRRVAQRHKKRHNFSGDTPQTASNSGSFFLMVQLNI